MGGVPVIVDRPACSRCAAIVIPGLVPGIQPSASAGASGTMDPGAKHRHDIDRRQRSCRPPEWPDAAPEFCGFGRQWYYPLTMTIDTLEYVKKLEAAGVDRKVAEAHAEAFRAAAEDELPTKTDFRLPRRWTSTCMFEQRLQRPMAGLEAADASDGRIATSHADHWRCCGKLLRGKRRCRDRGRRDRRQRGRLFSEQRRRIPGPSHRPHRARPELRRGQHGALGRRPAPAVLHAREHRHVAVHAVADPPAQDRVRGRCRRRLSRAGLPDHGDRRRPRAAGGERRAAAVAGRRHRAAGRRRAGAPLSLAGDGGRRGRRLRPIGRGLVRSAEPRRAVAQGGQGAGRRRCCTTG